MPLDSIFIDSNIIIAAFNKEDNSHDRAIGLLEKIKNNPKVINYLIFNEIATVLLLRTKDIDFVGQLTKHFLSKEMNDFKIVNLTKELMRKTNDVFINQNGSSLSFADCSLIAQAELRMSSIPKESTQKSMSKIATFDKDLKKAYGSMFLFLG